MEKEFLRLIRLMRRLRSPRGCPWDREQDHRSLLKCLVEETYEFYDAVIEGDFENMKEELGDLLLQVVFHGQLAQEKGKFTLTTVMKALCDKLVRRHPHVFGAARANSGEEGLKHWEKIKRSEKSYAHRTSALDGVAKTLPALSKAHKLQKKAAKVGFDWPGPRPVFSKIREELREVAEAAGKRNRRAVQDEMGDLLFACVNLARHLEVDPEESLAAANQKFARRFRGVESRQHELGRAMENESLQTLDRLWEVEKARERGRRR